MCRPLADVVGVGQGASLELVIDPLHQSAQIVAGTAGEEAHHLVQGISGVRDVPAVRLMIRVHGAAWLPKFPLAAGQGMRDGIGFEPIVLVFHTPDGGPGQGGDSADALNDNVSARPPLFSTHGLRAPTRHRPF